MIRRHRGERKIEFLKEIGLGEPDISRTEWEIDRILRHLPERSRRIVRLRYGIGTGISWTLKEIAQEFGISRQRVWEIKRSAIRTLRDKGASESGGDRAGRIDP